VPNAVLLNGSIGDVPPKMPDSVTLPVNAPAKAIHILTAAFGRGGPPAPGDAVPMVVRVHYEDGSTEDHEFKNEARPASGDRNGGSRPANGPPAPRLQAQSVIPAKKETIAAVELRKGNQPMAPIVLALTVEGFE
jgi:hypothetical protein